MLNHLQYNPSQYIPTNMNIRMECARTHWNMQAATAQLYRQQFEEGKLPDEDCVEGATECAMIQANTSISQVIFNCAPHQGMLTGIQNAWNNMDSNEVRQLERSILQHAYIDNVSLVADMKPEQQVSYFNDTLQMELPYMYGTTV